MSITIAIVLLIAPTVYFFARYLCDYGFSFRSVDGWGVFPIAAVILLSANVAALLGTEIGVVLKELHFSSRGYLIFFVSGIAYSVAIFPRLTAEGMLPNQAAANSTLQSLVAIPAWLWIMLIMILGFVMYPN
ncbi:hypothetical protein IC757_08055 [Wenzhouxiangella sp. AB-CW3]|uniref:hypothetical protein n=1 Tax=Wenzhouxiangella sp. AB-CW3 TaxID=2771012 RepID=UPI00168AE5F8|nr:hypothetical protein [Wenzhouxiangella sp. AB-CW3]QOC24043.1 hypothetical protein IC757_08055 [Wenzhouxiangella sp. AB-CW3]